MTDADATGAVRDDRPDGTVTAHASTPERTVFTERGNRDAWLATDLTVEPER